MWHLMSPKFPRMNLDFFIIRNQSILKVNVGKEFVICGVESLNRLTQNSKRVFQVKCLPVEGRRSYDARQLVAVVSRRRGRNWGDVEF